MPTADGKLVKKTKDQYNQGDFIKLSKNCRAMHVLYCGLDANKYNRICTCETVKQIWDKLMATYQGTSQARETKINMFVHQYELFNMQPNNTIKKMFTHFADITNNLKSLGIGVSNRSG